MIHPFSCKPHAPFSALKRAHRDRAAWLARRAGGDDAFTVRVYVCGFRRGRDHRFFSSRFNHRPHTLKTEIVDRTVDRLLDCKRTFGRALILGGATTATAAALARVGRGVERATVVDSSRAQLDRVAAAAKGEGWPELELVCGDEEEVELGEGRFDGK